MGLLPLLSATLVLAPTPAVADVTIQVCAQAYTDGQERRLENKPFSARKHFQICSNSGCPAPVVRDCTRWLSEVESELPAIVISVVDHEGSPLPEAILLVDGSEVRNGLNGFPVVLDEGTHVLRIEAAGFQPMEMKRSFRLDQGVVSHRVSLSPLRRPTGEESSTAPMETNDAIPTASLLLAGVGTVALGIGAYFGLSAQQRFDQLQRECGRTCTREQADSVAEQTTVADIALATGVIALGTAAVLYFTRPTASDASNSGRTGSGRASSSSANSRASNYEPSAAFRIGAAPSAVEARLEVCF